MRIYQPEISFSAMPGDAMIDEINYFPERDNFQKKKKAKDDWKDLKQKKLYSSSKKTKPEDGKNEPKSPSRTENPKDK